MKLKDIALEAVQDEQILNAIKERIVEKIASELSWKLGTDYVEELAKEIHDEIINDEEFRSELEKIKQQFKQKIIKQIQGSLIDALSQLKIKISTWRMNDALGDAVTISFEDKSEERRQ